VVAVIDDIIELGPSATQTHRLLWERLATMEVSAIFLTGKEFAPSLKKGLQDAGYAWQIFLLKKTWNKLFIEQLGSVSKQSTVVFMGRFTKPYLEKFLPMKD
jgi:UDP-N-acetylmuramyl pentapeptide synthase